MKKVSSGLCLALFAALPGAAEPFVPADDNIVLESGLPTVDPRMRELRALARVLRQNPNDIEAAMRLASRQLAMGVAEADHNRRSHRPRRTGDGCRPEWRSVGRRCPRVAARG